MPGEAPGPNVLFVTADQWRGDCLGAAGHPVVKTPHLARLAAGGVSFRRHFAQAAPCGPSRASLYTGMYLMNHRSVLNGTPLDARHTNVALMARDLGFEPVGYLPEGNPVAWLDWMRAAGVDVPDDWRPFVDRPAEGSRWRTQYDAKHSQTVYLTDRALDFVDDRSAAGQPWFAHVSYLRPHPPFLAPAPYDTMFDPAAVPAPVRAAT